MATVARSEADQSHEPGCRGPGPCTFSAFLGTLVERWVRSGTARVPLWDTVVVSGGLP